MPRSHAYFGDVHHAFRPKAITCFGPSRPGVSDHGAHRPICTRPLRLQARSSLRTPSHEPVGYPARASFANLTDSIGAPGRFRGFDVTYRQATQAKSSQRLTGLLLEPVAC